MTNRWGSGLALSLSRGCSITGWGVHSDVRRHGVGRQLQEAQQAWSKDHGYEYIRCECMNHQREFVHFAVALGYDIVGIRWDSTHADNLVVFEKNLSD
jgi:GNAT superfamily N-acetyltransferase